MKKTDLLIELFQNFDNPETIKLVEERIKQIRQESNYFMTLMQILDSNEFIKPDVETAVLIQMRTSLCAKGLTQSEMPFFRQRFMSILIRRSSNQNHKLFRDVIRISTQKLGLLWLDLPAYIAFIQNKEHCKQASNLCWIISALIGIPQTSPRFNMNYYQKQISMKNFEPLFQVLLDKTQECFPAQLRQIINFLHQYISVASEQHVHQILQKSLAILLSLGIELWKGYHPKVQSQKQCFDQKAEPQISESRYQYIRLINQVLLKQQLFSNKVGSQSYQIWKNQRSDILINLFLVSFSQMKGELLYLTLKTSYNLIRQLRPPFIFSRVEQLLYITIPKMLYNLKDIVLILGKPIVCDVDKNTYQRIKLKNMLLNMWVMLSRIDLSPYRSSSEKKSHVKKKQIVTLTELPTNVMHFKFIFQKISQCETFFSPFEFQSSLASQNCWQFGDQGWIIGAFDLLKAINLSLIQDVANQQFKKSMPAILIAYVVPKLANPDNLIQDHALSVLATYSNDFSQLSLAQTTVNVLYRLVMKPPGKSIALKLLQSFTYNQKVMLKISKNADAVVDKFIQHILQVGDQQLATCFEAIMNIFGHKLSDPENCFSRIVERFLSIDLEENEIQQSGITSCINCFSTVPLVYKKIQQHFLKLVEFTIFSIQQFDFQQSMLQQELLMVISNFIARQETEPGLLMIFIAYCLHLSGYDQRVICQIKNKPIIQSSKRITKKKIASFDKIDQRILNAIWVLHAFSIKQNFISFQQSIGTQPIKIYIATLDAILCRAQRNDDELEGYLQMIEVILYGVIYIIDEFQIQKVEQQTQLELLVIIYELIYRKNKDIIFFGLKQNQDLQNCQYKNYIKRVRNRLAQVWSTILLIYPNAEFYFSELGQLTSDYLRLVQNPSKNDYNDMNYLKRNILGVSSLLQMPSLYEHVGMEAFTALYKLVQINVNRQLRQVQRWDKFEENDDDGSDEELSLDQQDELFEEFNFLDSKSKYFAFNIQKVKQILVIDNYDQLQALSESIDVLKKKGKELFSENKEVIHKITNKIELMLTQGGPFDFE